MNVSALTGPRFDLALEKFRSGEPFLFEQNGFVLTPDGFLECRTPSSYRAENATAATAERDIDEARALTDRLTMESGEFAAVVSGRPRRYVVLDDYGMGAVEVARFVP